MMNNDRMNDDRMNDDRMNDNLDMNELEQKLTEAAPRGVRPALRAQVLAAVAEVLPSNSLQADAIQAEPGSPWLRRAGLAVAASLLLGVGLNVWLSRRSEQVLAQLYGPPPISKQAMEIAQDIGKTAGPEMTQWVYQRLAPKSRDRSIDEVYAEYAAYCAMLTQLTEKPFLSPKESKHETPQKNPQMDRDRSGRIGGNPFDCQCLVRLDDGQTA
jgi:hypothetical protein